MLLKKCCIVDSSDVTSTDDVRGPVCSGYTLSTQKNEHYSYTSIDGIGTERLIEESKSLTIEEYKDIARKIPGLHLNHIRVY